MTNLEHFESGRTGQPIPITKVATKPVARPTFIPKPRGPEPVDEFLGASVAKGEGQNSAKDLYAAENHWFETHPTPSVKLDRAKAQNLAQSILNHPSMDSIPGIEDIRTNFDPKQISFHNRLSNSTASPEFSVGGIHVNYGNALTGNMNQLQFSTGYKPRHPEGRIDLGALTHELSHYIVNNAPISAPSDHHWPMARLHLHILKNAFRGTGAYQRLKSAYDKFGINYGGK